MFVRTNLKSCLVAAAVCAVLGCGRSASSATFSRDILPVLSDNCFSCHGPDEKARKAKLRLDTKEGAFRVKDDVHVIVPGKSTKSELDRRLTSKDPDDVMPPPKSTRKLSADQIEQIKKWIDAGAVWGEHWAFEKITKPALPKLKKPAGRI